MIKLIVADAGHTLCEFTGPSTVDVLSGLSRLPEDMVAEEERRILHRVPELTEAPGRPRSSDMRQWLRDRRSGLVGAACPHGELPNPIHRTQITT